MYEKFTEEVGKVWRSEDWTLDEKCKRQAIKLRVPMTTLMARSCQVLLAPSLHSTVQQQVANLAAYPSRHFITQ